MKRFRRLVLFGGVCAFSVLVGCADRVALIALPSGQHVAVSTYGATSESAREAADAATRLMAMQACTADDTLKVTDGCQKLLAEQIPANHPGEPFNSNRSNVDGRGCPFFPSSAYASCVRGW